jgi:predicted transcriptional regulator of viral defense system
MDFERLLDLIGDEPLFETGLLLAGRVNPAAIRLQLGRWVKSGRIIQLRRGLYAIAPPYQKIAPHPFHIANRLQRGSYIGLQSALAFHGLIPEGVHQTLSVTSGRPGQFSTPLGNFVYRHIKPDLLRGYRMIDLDGQQAWAATTEKALLDLVYLQTGADSEAYLNELRLQNLDQLDVDLLTSYRQIFGSPKMNRAIDMMLKMRMEQSREYETL